MATSVLEANRAAAAAFGISSPSDSEDGDLELDPHIPAMTYRRASWSFERSVDTREALGVGDKVTFTKRITDEDVRSFASASGDTNRLHLDESFARNTRFGGRIVHGTLISGLISAALARLPGLTIYLAQDLQFLKPVEIGETVTAVCEIVEDLGDSKFRLTTMVHTDDDEVVIDGEAVVLIDELPNEDPEE